MEQIKQFLFLLLLFSCLFYISSQGYTDLNNLKEKNTDYMGFYKISREYNMLMKEKIKIVNLPELNSFFAIWLPGDFNNQSIKRTLIAIHGSEGTVYPEIKDELDLAKKYKYAIRFKIE